MSKLCGTSGGKGNFGKFIERDPMVCAAGVATSQPTSHVSDHLQHFLMQDEAEALIRDAIHPTPKPRKLPPLRRPPKPDARNSGPYNEVRALINPPAKTKFQALVADFNETVYTSYWKKNTGTVPDPVPTLPQGFDTNTTLGKKLDDCGRLYDIVMPKVPLPDKTRATKQTGYQTNRNYCEPYDPNKIFGMRYNYDPRGKWAKCCLINDDVIGGTGLRKPVNTRLANFMDANRAKLGVPTTPFNNISCVPDGYSFGILHPPSSKTEECMITCEFNPKRELLKKCLAHLNTLRKFMSKRFETTLFKRLYLTLRYYDREESGWLAKDIIYKYCNSIFIHFNPELMEPLLEMWGAFDGSRIKYETFVHILNFSHPSPELPKIRDIAEDCIDFRTTYTEMVKPGQEIDKRQRAGLPSGRYFDLDYPVTPVGCCKADRTYLPQETNMRANLTPSVFSHANLSHRDLFAKREPDLVRKVFEAAGETFDDEVFEKIWTNAKRYHSQGWVCFETFRRSKAELESEDKH